MTRPARYRIVPDNFSLCVEERRVAGAKAASPGEVTWVKESWPGNLVQTAQFLLERLTVDNATEQAVTDAQALVQAVEDATVEVKTIVAKYAGARA